MPRDSRLQVGTPLIGGLEIGTPESGRDLHAIAQNIRPQRQAPAIGMPRHDAQAQSPGLAAAPRKRRPQQQVKPWHQDQEQLDSVWGSLLAKAATVENTGALGPAKGMLTLGHLPQFARDLVPKEAGNIIGWDPSRLDERERWLANRLALFEEERRAKEAAAPQVMATAEDPNAFAGQMP